MTEVGFYHLTRSTLDEALPRLLEKAYAAGNRVLVRVGDPERLELLNRALWTYGKESFLPHGTRSDGFAEDQPIYLTTQVENPNGGHRSWFWSTTPQHRTSPRSTAASTCSTAAIPKPSPAPASAGAAARAAGHGCTYWQQGERGGWVKAGS